MSVLISPFQVLFDPVFQIIVIFWIRVLQYKIVHCTKLGLDAIHPRGIGSGGDQPHAVVLTPLEIGLGSMCRKIVHNKYQPSFYRVSSANDFQKTQELLAAFAFSYYPKKVVSFKIVTSQQVPDPMMTGVGGRQTLWFACLRPATPWIRTYLQRTKLIHANNSATYRRTFIQKVYQVFFSCTKDPSTLSRFLCVVY